MESVRLCQACQGLLRSVPEGQKPETVEITDEGQHRQELLACEDCSTRYIHNVKTDQRGMVMVDEVLPAQQADSELEAQSDRGELLEKLRRLEENHREVERMKKAMASDYNDQLKSIKDEIGDTLSLLKDTEAKKSDEASE